MSTEPDAEQDARPARSRGADKRSALAKSPAIEEFNQWLENFKVAGAASASEVTGKELAHRRRALMARLIKEDPQSAVEVAVPAHLKAKLPEEVRLEVEQSISGYGDYLVRVFDEADSETGRFTHGRTERRVVINGKTYEARVYGYKEGMTTKQNIAIRGVAMDGVMALAESPVRELQAEERDAFAEGVEVEVGGRRERFENQDEVERFKEKLKKQELMIGPGGTGAVSEDNEAVLGAVGEEGEKLTTGASSWTEGAKTLLFIRVDFPDATGEPLDSAFNRLTVARVQSLVAEINNFYTTSSYNKTSITATITSVMRMPQTAAFYGGQDPSRLLADARAEALAAGYPNTHTFDIIAFKRIPAFSWAGLGHVGGKGSWLNGAFDFRVAAHELGHNYGLYHANLWKTTGGTAIGAGTSQEYNDPFDTMGGGSTTPSYHFNAWFKNMLNWLPSVDAPVISSPGTYRIQAYDSVSATGRRALKIQRDADTYYWIELRQALVNNGSVMNGAVIHWGYTFNRQSNLLDMTPTTTGDDQALAVGQTFTDAANGIQIKAVGKVGTALDVAVNFTTGNLSALTLSPPTLFGGNKSTGTITLDSPAPPLGAVVTLSDNLASTTLPPSVTFPPGIKSKTFTITTTNVTAIQSGTVTASFRGIDKTAALSVEPLTPSALTLTTPTIGGGGSVTATVTLNAPAPTGGATVTLSDNIAAVTTPAYVLIPAGLKTRTFTVTTAPVTTSQSGFVTASLGGVNRSAPLTVAPIALSALTLNPVSVAGGVNVAGTVTLNGPAPSGGAVITLSDNLAATTIPASITIPAGASGKTFTITTQIVAANQSGNVNASYGAISKTAALTVKPAALYSLTLDPASVAGGNSVTGTVALDGPAPAGGAIIALSDNLTTATTPASATIPAGARTATFTITTAVVSLKQAGTVSASRNGVVKTAALAVRPVSVQSVTMSANPIPGGSAATGTVTLERTSSTNIVVTLSDTLAATTMPATVTVPAGRLSSNFPVSTTLALPSQAGVLSATANGETRTLSLKVVNTISQLMGNPGFEQVLVSWTGYMDPMTVFFYEPRYAHTGLRSGQLGGSSGSGTSTYADYIYQDVTVPANAISANLNFYLWIISRETTTTQASDIMKLQIRDTGGAILATPATYSNLNKTTGYVKKTVNLLPYKGQTIRIYFMSSQSGELESWYYIDDVTLDVLQ